MSEDTHNDRLDRAIDHAVRKRVQLEPRAGIRGRVLARISEPSRHGMLLPGFAFAAAALAALMLVVFVVRRDVQAPALVSLAPPVPAAPAGASPSPLAGTRATAPKTEEPAPPPTVPVVATRQRPTSEPIRMPPVANVFGPRDSRATAANVPEPAGIKAAVPEPPASRPIEIPPLSMTQVGQDAAAPAGRRPNVTIELTISDRSGASEPVKKVVTMIVADRQAGSVRSRGVVTTSAGTATAASPGESRAGVTLNVDATPAIQADGAILVSLTLEYTPAADGSGARAASQLNERMSVVVESGKAIVISQAADAGSDRRVTVELKATISR